MKRASQDDKSVNSAQWEVLLSAGIKKMLAEFLMDDSADHVVDTPARVIKAYREMFSGCFKEPEDVLTTTFANSAHQPQMIHVKEITFHSTCAHHLLPFFGVASFAYIPKGKIVGISKIPRLVDMFASRPQVQEELSSSIVDAFQRIVEPNGCGLMMRAYHLCCMSRGIKQPTSYTETTALAGNFFDPSVKAEFLASCNSSAKLL